MKVGDIIYVKQPYTARYGKKGGSNKEYHFVPGDIYQITYIVINSIIVINIIGDGVSHYIDDTKERFYTLEEWREEWREKQLNEIGI
jgi:hypothetical protein